MQDPRQAWLNEAIARWEKPLLRLCYAYLCDTAMAEDAVQETFLQSLEELRTLSRRSRGKDLADAYRNQHLQGPAEKRLGAEYGPVRRPRIPAGRLGFL